MSINCVPANCCVYPSYDFVPFFLPPVHLFETFGNGTHRNVSTTTHLPTYPTFSHCNCRITRSGRVPPMTAVFPTSPRLFSSLHWWSSNREAFTNDSRTYPQYGLQCDESTDTNVTMAAISPSTNTERRIFARLTPIPIIKGCIKFRRARDRGCLHFSPRSGEQEYVHSAFSALS